MGLVGLAIPTTQFFENYATVNNINSQFLVAYDREGNYIATPRSELLGKNFFSEEVQRFFNYNADQNNLYHEVFSERRPSYVVYDFGGGERLNTGYPVIINGQPVYFIFVVTPTETIYSQIEGILSRQQTDLFIQRAISVAAIAAIAFFIIRLNSKLKQKVKDRTKSLEESNEKLVRANEKLGAHDRLQREFINIAAHELRTPIVPILTLSEFLYSKTKGGQLQQGKAPEEEKEMLEIILRNANRLHQLTEDILDVTRIESHTLKLREERFNLNNVILNVVDDYRKRIAANGNVKVIHELSNGTIIVEADRRRLTQVISNLFGNAIKFTKEGTVTVTTTIRGKKDLDRDSAKEKGAAAVAAEVVIAVKDTGTGIDPELMPRLFTKFATKSYQGTGLGLFISKSIVEAHGGKMWAENNNKDGSDFNRQHRGATFYFTIPVVAETELGIREEKEAILINDQRQL
jgi:signal transduction histidine kinase